VAAPSQRGAAAAAGASGRHPEPGDRHIPAAAPHRPRARLPGGDEIVFHFNDQLILDLFEVRLLKDGRSSGLVRYLAAVDAATTYMILSHVPQ